jgi:diguanylate cyclase (GGDEF)-like protein
MSAPQGTQQPLRRLVRAVVAVGALVVALASGWWAEGPHLGWPQALLVLALVAIGDVAEVSMRLGEHRVRFSSGEAMLLLGYATGSPPAVVVLAAVVLATGELVRRQRSALKAAYNVASASIAATMGALVVTVGGASAAAPRDWPVLAVAAAVVVLAQGLLISAAVARSTGSGIWEVFARGHGHRLVLWAANVVLAVAVLAAWTWNRSVIVGIVLVALSGSSLLARLMRARDELDGLRRLDLATRTLPGLDETEVLTSVCHQACELLGIDSAEIVLADTLSPDGDSVIGYVFRAAPDTAPSRRPLSPEDRDALRGASETGVLNRQSSGVVVAHASLRAGDSHVGLLRATLPATQASGPELHLLAALATTAGGAVLNARMYAAQRRHAEELRATAARDYRQARRDALTGLGNRTGLMEHGESCLDDARARDVGLLLLDLNHFKEVNDTLGRAAGDELLRRVGRRLREFVDPASYLARLSADEFALLVPAPNSLEALEELGQRLLARLREPIMVDGLRLTAEACIGVAWAPEHATNMDELLRCADVAMYRAKSTNQSLLPYDPERDDSAVERLEVLAAVQAGLVRGDIVVHYQPKVDVASGRLTGMEALCRWQHPEQGLLLPGAFMPVVEHSSVINELTHHVLRTAAADAVSFSETAGPTSVAVNISPRCLLDVTFATEVANTLRETGLPPQLLVLEITETLALVELDTVDLVLGELRRLGIRLSVDDFGTGYSSLTFLQRVDVHEVKIDRSFVGQMQERPEACAIVEATIELAHRLGLIAVAEGVETTDQLDALAAAGCDQVQGYLVARPMALPALEQWYRDKHAYRQAAIIPFPREADHEVTA